MIAYVTPAAEALTDLLYRVEQHRRALVTEMLAPYRLTLTQWVALRILWMGGSSSMTELAQASFIDRTSLTRTIDVLIARGFVIRSSLPGDRRAVIVAVSAGGAILAEQAAQAEKALERHMLAKVDRGRQESLVQDLCRILDSAPRSQPAVHHPTRRSRFA